MNTELKVLAVSEFSLHLQYGSLLTVKLNLNYPDLHSPEFLII